MSDIKFENIVTGEKIKLSRRPAVEAYIKSGDLHKNAHNYDLGWRIDPVIRALWEKRYDDKAYIRTVAKEKKMNPLEITIYSIIDFWLDEVFEVDELEMRANRDGNLDAQKDYLKRVAEAGGTGVTAQSPATEAVKVPVTKSTK